MTSNNMEKVFEGYTPTHKACEAYLRSDGALFIKYTHSGIARRFNDEHYAEDEDIAHMLVMAGFSRCC